MRVAVLGRMKTLDQIPASNDTDGHYGLFIDHDGERHVVRTLGMHSFDLPELVMEDVSPPCLVSSACDLVAKIADYMIASDRPVRVGETVLLDHSSIVRIASRPNDEEGYACWALEDVPDVFCPECEGGDHELYERLSFDNLLD